MKKIVEVSYVKDPDKRKAYLVEQGPEVSLIRFIHSGAEQCVGNEWLVLVENKPKPTT